MLDVLKIDLPFATPQIGPLARAWSTCSDLCHIGWTLASSLPGVRAQAFDELTQSQRMLAELAVGLGWPIVRDATFADLQARFVSGQATVDDVGQYAVRTGMWARVERQDGGPSVFVGEPIPPS